MAKHTTTLFTIYLAEVIANPRQRKEATHRFNNWGAVIGTCFISSIIINIIRSILRAF